MPRPPAPLEDWYADIIDTMIVERATFEQAAIMIGLQPMSPEDVNNHTRRKSFRDLFESMTRAHYERLGDATEATKNRLVGEMRADATRLREMGKIKEAADVTAAAAKILGYTSPDTNISFWDSLSGLSIEELKKRLSRPNSIQ